MGKREKRISNYISRYVICVCSLVFITAIGIVIALISVTWEPANKVETDVSEWITEAVLSGAPDFSKLTNRADYFVVDANGNCVERNVSAEFRENFDRYAHYLIEENRDRIFYRNEVYLSLKFGSETVFIHYGIHTDKYLIILTVVGTTLLLLSLLVPTVLLVHFFKKNILCVKEYAENFSNENLEVEKIRTSVKELNEVTNAIDHMRETLTDNLKEKWKKEQTIKKNMASMAHDLKTPLTIIHGNAELLKETAQNPEEQEMLEKIISNSEKIANGVLNIMDCE